MKRLRVKVYDQAEENVEAVEVKLNTTQAFLTSSPSFIPQPVPVPTLALNAASSPFIPQSPTVQSQNQASPTSLPMPHVQNSSDLINVLAGAISANHLPTPEPAVFTGVPLKSKDWRMSFETLIDRKNLPHREKLYYLRGYLGATAKTAVKVFFLTGTEVAHESAWQLLEKRFGNTFIIGKALNKLQKFILRMLLN